MNDDIQTNAATGRVRPVTPRDLLGIVFRHRMPLALTFCSVLFAAMLYIILKAPEYEAHMTILVKRERIDPIVTAENTPLQQFSQGVTEQELNSEVELLRGRDLLEKVVVAMGLAQQRSASSLNRLREWIEPSRLLPERRLAAAVVDLEDHIGVEPVKKTTLIQVTYKAGNPVFAARVLSMLANLYLEKHLAVHRAPGALDFFDREAEHYRQNLAAAQTSAGKYATKEGVISVALEKEIAVRQIGALEEALHKSEVQIAETAQRIRALERQIAATPERITTERRDAQARLMETQKSTLLSLELKRIELQHTFQPDYPPLVEVDKQIAKTGESIEAAKTSPIVEEVTNRDPTYDYLALERAKARTELTAVEANVTATRQTLARQRQHSNRLYEIEIYQGGIERDAKLAEQNYMTYIKKGEEARISNALDVQRIVNVVVAEAPSVPALPTGPRRAVVILAALVLASVVSFGLALTFDYFDSSFRTPEEVEAFLGSPVLAALPSQGR
jgi:uncharacterized protein involved in exopolysaccharide biosynthesis